MRSWETSLAEGAVNCGLLERGVLYYLCLSCRIYYHDITDVHWVFPINALDLLECGCSNKADARACFKSLKSGQLFKQQIARPLVLLPFKLPPVSLFNWKRFSRIPPLFMRAIAILVRREILTRKAHNSLGAMRLTDRKERGAEPVYRREPPNLNTIPPE